MSKKKGFTLVELLAVIVILAIIALIATPIILGVIEDAKKGAAKASALGYLDAVEKQIAINMINSDTVDDITDNTYTVTQLESKGVSVKGNKPIGSSTITIIKGNITNYELVIENYKIVYNSSSPNEPIITKVDKLGDEEKEDKGPTMIVANEGETHKGIVYLDPTNLSKTCNESNSVSTTETKTGCMKWYIFNDSGDNYTMILDHNTTARIKWNDSNSNVSYESSNLYAVVQDLKTTSGWVVEPRLITVEEINNIIGKNGFDASNTSSWYYFDTLTQTKATFTDSVRSKYDWLYNNVNKCKTDSTDYGCSIEDLNVYEGYGTAESGNTWGYWISTTVGSAGSGNYVWDVNRHGYLYGDHAYATTYGVRPVITIAKTLIES